jgi:translation initiation factor 2 alpha subunit (eIF-2alpha)
MVYYYKNKLPAIDDIVVARVLTISHYGVEVSLNEYSDIRGFINCGEVSRKKKVNMNKILTIGKDVLLHVIQVNEENMSIDLSKRTIGDEDIKLFNEKHKLHIQLYNIFKQLYMKLNNLNSPDKIIDENLHQFICKTLFEIQTDFENEYIIEKLLSKDTNQEILDTIDFEDLNINMDVFKNVLDNYIDNKINRTKPELTESVKLMTYSVTGVSDLKYSLDLKNFTNYQDLTKDFDIQINYITASTYSIIISQKDFDLVGQIPIEDAILSIKQEIKSRAVEKQIQNQIVI